MSPPKPLLLAYVACWAELDAKAVAGNLLTHVNYAFAVIDSAGKLVPFMNLNYESLAKDDPALKALGYEEACRRAEADLSLARRLKAAYPHLTLLISIGGWAAEGFSDAALTEASREQFADNAISFMKEHGFDGLDLDWEFPGNDMAGIRAQPEDRQNFTLLLRTLRQKLDATSLADGRTGSARYLLTVAVGAMPSLLEGTDIAAIAPELDFINLMTYDFYNGWSTQAGHHSNLFASASDPNGESIQKTVAIFRDAGVAPEKLVIGAAFYGRGMTLLAHEQHGLMQASEKGSNFTRTYEEILPLLGPDSAWSRHWDEAAQAPYLSDGKCFLSYEDEASVRAKARFARAQGLGGVMFWEYSNNRSGQLLRALHSALYED